jgi:queuine tRNA-ribosyltransferase
MAGEILSMRLNTLHNLHYYATVVRAARAAVESDRYAEFLGADRSRRTDRGGHGDLASFAMDGSE